MMLALLAVGFACVLSAQIACGPRNRRTSEHERAVEQLRVEARATADSMEAACAAAPLPQGGPKVDSAEAVRLAGCALVKSSWGGI